MTDAKKKILIVDDSEDSMDMMELYLYKDYEILTAFNGFEGLNKALTDRPDCIITDIMMPVMDGIKFFNTLKGNPDTMQIPVIAVTSFTKEHSIKSLFNLGFSDVLNKPVSGPDIADSIVKALAKT